MKNQFIYLIVFFCLFVNLTFSNQIDEKSRKISTSYFPINNKTKLIYKTSFGESITSYSKEGENTISSSESDNFKYRQTMVLTENGVYIKETSQYLKILLFIKKEGTFTYSKPLLRFPLPLYPGLEWKCETDEYCDGDTSKVIVKGKVISKELVTTKAGTFEAMKLESLIEGVGNTKNRVTEWFSEGIGLIKAKIIIEGGGVMGFMRDILGYGTIEFELKEIRKQ